MKHEELEGIGRFIRTAISDQRALAMFNSLATAARRMIDVCEAAHVMFGDTEGPRTPAQAHLFVRLNIVDPSTAAGSETCPCEARDDCDECASGPEILTNVAALAAKSDQPALWCCHVLGPDDVHATANYRDAVDMAQGLNTAIRRSRQLYLERGGDPDNDPLCIAVPALWPHDAASHAADVAKAIEPEKHGA